MNGTATQIAAWLGLLIAAAGTGRNTFHLMRDEHRARQESRRETYRYAPPWYLCWPFWIGIEQLVFRGKLDTTHHWFPGYTR